MIQNTEQQPISPDHQQPPSQPVFPNKTGSKTDGHVIHSIKVRHPKEKTQHLIPKSAFSVHLQLLQIMQIGYVLRFHLAALQKEGSHKFRRMVKPP